MFKIVLITKNFIISLNDSSLLIRSFKKFIFINIKSNEVKITSNDLSGFIDKIEETKKSIRVKKKKDICLFLIIHKIKFEFMSF